MARLQPRARGSDPLGVPVPRTLRRRARLRRAALAGGIALGLGVAPAAPAAAEIYKCVAADGSTTFTSHPGACPKAVPHEPKGRIQTVPRRQGPPRVAPFTPRGSSPAAAAQDLAQAARWKAKRTRAENEKARVDHDVEAYRQVVTGCNRGSSYTIKDDTGIKREFRCEEARSRYQQLQSRQAELDRYLSGGLEEECRRAGCLPGWIR